MERRALRLPAVCAKTGLSKSSIYALEKAGKFVSRFRLSENISVWWEFEVDAWLEQRAAQPLEAPRTVRPGPGRPRKPRAEADQPDLATPTENAPKAHSANPGKKVRKAVSA